jgi:GxxExxY protein
MSNTEVIYKELSYKIVGILFDVYNQLGPGHSEKTHERAVANGLNQKLLNFRRQVQADLIYNNEYIGKFFLDFLIENKIILELKIGRKFSKLSFNQVFNYLKATQLKLAILATFAFSGVKFIRLLNINNKLNALELAINPINFRKLFIY